MCDEIRLFGMLNRIDERTEIIKEQQDNIFERLQKLEQKGPTCDKHDALVTDIANLKTENKITSLIFASIGTISVLIASWFFKLFRP